MSSHASDTDRHVDRRARAVARLSGGCGGARVHSAAALAVLHDLAASPSTAADALALLHELQVHQVELDMQDEEMRSSRAALEAALARQIQLYDASPAACCTIDRRGVIAELNLTAAHLLGADRGALIGRALSGLLDPPSADVLHALLSDPARGGASRGLKLSPPGGATRTLHAAVSADPAGPGFLLAFIESPAAAG
jgi:PAS domain-containing protein